MDARQRELATLGIELPKAICQGCGESFITLDFTKKWCTTKCGSKNKRSRNKKISWKPGNLSSM